MKLYLMQLFSLLRLLYQTERMTNTLPQNAKIRWIRGLGWERVALLLRGLWNSFLCTFGQFFSHLSEGQNATEYESEEEKDILSLLSFGTSLSSFAE